MTEPHLTVVPAHENDGDDDRNRAAKMAEHLSGLLGGADAEVMADIAGRVQWIRVPSGHQLFAEGDPPDGAYVVVIGRLRVVLTGSGGAESLGERIIDEVGPGQSVGEMALLTRKPRSATVYAARDSELVWISSEVFDYIVDRYPRVLLATSRVLVERLQRQMRGAVAAPHRARTFAVVPCNASVDVTWFTDQLVRCMSRAANVLRLSAARVEQDLGVRGIARSAPSEAGDRRLSSWLMAQERSHDLIVYEADAAASEWTARTVRHADSVLFVADGAASPELGEAEQWLERRNGTQRLPRASLVLLQPDGKHAYPGTKRWLGPRARVLGGGAAHHHVRRGRCADVERVARILTGNAVGVVFGGGGSRGYAHIGVLRALEQLGVPIDAAGGVSIGAVVAMAKGLELDAAEILRVVPPLMRSAFFDPTLPVASLMRGEHTLRGLKQTVGDIAMEDFVLPIFAVSTNLTRGEVVVHREGPAATAIRASGSVPGIFPPVPWNGDLLVDGGLSNNLPCDVMASLFATKMVAVDVIPDVDLRADGDLPSAVSGFRVAWQRLNPFAQRFAMPSILSTLMRSATTSSRGLQMNDAIRRPHLLYLKPRLRRWNLVDFSLAEVVEREGYETTIEAITAWWQNERPSRHDEEVSSVVQ